MSRTRVLSQIATLRFQFFALLSNYQYVNQQMHTILIELHYNSNSQLPHVPAFTGPISGNAHLRKTNV